MRIVVGAVSQLYQGDLDLGRRVVERLAAEPLPSSAMVEDFHYGAVAVAQRLEDLAPEALVLVGAEEGGTAPPGSVSRELFRLRSAPPGSSQEAVGNAVTGEVSMDLVLEVGAALGALPARTVVFRVEPARTEPSTDLSPEAARGLEEVLGAVRRELARLPLFDLADRLLSHLDNDRELQPSPALDTARRLAASVEAAERSGAWGAAFRLGEELRLRIAAGETGEGMDHLDWGLWWGLVEGLQRLQAEEAEPV